MTPRCDSCGAPWDPQPPRLDRCSYCNSPRAVEEVGGPVFGDLGLMVGLMASVMGHQHALHTAHMSVGALRAFAEHGDSDGT